MQCLLWNVNFPCRENAFLQFSQRNGFSPLWTRKWSTKCFLRLKFFWQTGHFNVCVLAHVLDFWTACMNKCDPNFHLNKNLSGHTGHSNRCIMLACFRAWTTKSSLCLKYLSQEIHWNLYLHWSLYFSEWLSTCTVKSFFRLKRCPHTEHWCQPPCTLHIW